MTTVSTLDGLVAYYSITDLAVAIGISPSYCYRRVNGYRTLPAPMIKIGKRYYYSQVEYEALIATEQKRLVVDAHAGRLAAKKTAKKV